MNAIQTIAGKADPEHFAITASMALQHLGNLFTFLDTRLGELVMFDPEALVKEHVIREALKVGGLVCRVMVQDSKECGAPPEQMRDLWSALVEEAVRRNIPPEAP